MRSIEELMTRPRRAEMLPDFIVARAALLRQRQSEEAADQSAVPARRDQLRNALGLSRLPESRSTEYLGTFQGEGYSVEKVLLQRAPGLQVPALLYVPDGDGPFPALVHPPGHWMEDGKLAPDLQIFNQSLAQNGVIVLCYDTLGQGERRVGWHQHGQLGPLLVGLTSLGLMVAETLAGLDLLASRSEVDDQRLGVVGASGGAFSSIFAAAIDERISIAAISCMVNTHVSQIRDAAFGTGWDSWVDLCNQVPGLAAIAPMSHILACIAPRQLLVANALEDPGFPIAGAREVIGDLTTILQGWGDAESLTYLEVPGNHGLLPDMRAAVGRFLIGKLTGQAPNVAEPSEPLFAPLWAVPHNRSSARQPQVKSAGVSAGACLRESVDSNIPMVDLARDRATELRLARQQLTVSQLGAFMGPFPDRVALETCVENHVSLTNMHAQRLTIKSEPTITLDALFALPQNWSDELSPVLVLLDEGGKQQALRSPEFEAAHKQGWAILMPDLRGTGESAASEFETASGAWMLDRDLLNQRIWDTMRIVDFISDRYSSAQQLDKGRIVIWGRDSFGLVALLAAALDDRVSGACASELESLEEFIQVNAAASPMVYKHRMLEVFDLANLVDLMRPRKALLRSSIGGIGSALSELSAGDSGRHE